MFDQKEREIPQRAQSLSFQPTVISNGHSPAVTTLTSSSTTHPSTSPPTSDAPDHAKMQEYAKMHKIVCTIYFQGKQNGAVTPKDYEAMVPIVFHLYKALRGPMTVSQLKKETSCPKCGSKVEKSYTVCEHIFCPRCLEEILSGEPQDRATPWYTCGLSSCGVPLHPSAFAKILSAKSNGCMLKNVVKICGELFSRRLSVYPLWKKCESCEFGFLAQPDVNFNQTFDLTCEVCGTNQHVHLVSPEIRQYRIDASLVPPTSSSKMSAPAKICLFIRHGQAENNVRDMSDTDVDPSLTPVGREQCQFASAHLIPFFDVQCVLTSPMNRTLETMDLMFGHQKSRPDFPIVALESLRELMVPFYNKRKPVSEKKKQFPYVDFSSCTSDEDSLFAEKQPESLESISERLSNFVTYLHNRPEHRIAVVAHEGTFHTLFNITNCSRALRQRFRNAECRMGVLTAQ